jgi:hypothetical protein
MDEGRSFNSRTGTGQTNPRRKLVRDLHDISHRTPPRLRRRRARMLKPGAI